MGGGGGGCGGGGGGLGGGACQSLVSTHEMTRKCIVARA